MSTDAALFVRNGGVRLTRQEARGIGKRFHERAMAHKRHETGDSVWEAWLAALNSCGLDVRIVRKDPPAEGGAS